MFWSEMNRVIRKKLDNAKEDLEDEFDSRWEGLFTMLGFPERR